jgi:hypothetical protein
MDFLNQTEGERIVSDFYAKWKQHDGSRFKESFQSAVRDLGDKCGSYYLKNPNIDYPLKKAYQLLVSTVVSSIMNENLSEENAVGIIAICIFYVLHDQHAEV